MTKTLKSAIKSFLRNAGLEQGVSQNNALFLWNETVGPTIAENTEAESVEHGVITVKTSTPSWRQELQFQKKDIVKKINKQLGKHTIKDIRFI